MVVLTGKNVNLLYHDLTFSIPLSFDIEKLQSIYGYVFGI